MFKCATISKDDKIVFFGSADGYIKIYEIH